jgi:aminopeptidase N
LSVALLFGVCFAPARTRDDYPRSPTLDAIHYRIQLDIKENTDEIKAETEILLAAGADSIRQVTLDFAGLIVDGVAEDGKPARFTRSDEKLNIALQGNYRRGDRLRLAVKYHGRPADGLFIKKNKFGDPSAFADNWPNRARYWFPAIDHPYDKATVEFFITAPARFDVIANGALIETTSRADGTEITRWRETVPIPTYCMVVGATEFSIVNAGSSNAVPVHYYLYPKDKENGSKDFGRAVAMLEFYASLIGPYPYEKLALVESSTRFGGMENSSNIFFDEKAINGSGRLEGTVAHEIAHQWFGDSVTEADWHHLWLSEGFATYFGHLFFERADGRDKFIGQMLADRERYLNANRASPRPIHDPAVTDLMQLLNANNYQKGGWVLHMLRHVLGDEKFFAGVREYYRTHRDRTALTADLQRILEFHASRPLDWFFNQWIYEAGHPVYDASWRWDASARELRLRITQKQQKPLFQMPLDVEIQMDKTTRREVVQPGEREQTFSFKLEGRPRRVAIDPGEWVLKELTLKEDSNMK